MVIFSKNAIRDVVHERLYGEDLKKWIENVEITCISKSSFLFSTPLFKEC